MKRKMFMNQIYVYCHRVIAFQFCHKRKDDRRVVVVGTDAKLKQTMILQHERVAQTIEICTTELMNENYCRLLNDDNLFPQSSITIIIIIIIDDYYQ